LKVYHKWRGWNGAGILAGSKVIHWLPAKWDRREKKGKGIMNGKKEGKNESERQKLHETLDGPTLTLLKNLS